MGDVWSGRLCDILQAGITTRVSALHIIVISNVMLLFDMLASMRISLKSLLNHNTFGE